MNATPRRLRSISTSLFAAVTAVALSACVGVSSDSEEQVELASLVIEGELPELTIDADALACAIDLAELQLEGDAPIFDVPPPGPCPPPVINTIDAPNTAPDSMLSELAAPTTADDEPLEPIDPLEHVPETETRPGKLGTVPQGPISIDRLRLRPITAEPVPPKPLGIEAPAEGTSEPERMACVNTCVQAYAVCVAHPDNDLLTCADQLSTCSEGC